MFSAKTGQEIIEASKLSQVSFGWENLPFSNQKEFDTWHSRMRESICLTASKNLNVNGKCTHGIAAKLINIYLKTIFVVGVHGKLNSSQTTLLNLIHPPIDRTLLNELAKNNIGGYRSEWRKFIKIGFSSFTSTQYENVIELVIKSNNGNPLWMIEEHFKGYQK
ncbi:hypothetical protein K2P47_03315 [Patescibacteria group bacterium]|nr:hypothetical protein [Patescibacteria group bacterium]